MTRRTLRSWIVCTALLAAPALALAEGDEHDAAEEADHGSAHASGHGGALTTST
jgi:hypothetical protein